MPYEAFAPYRSRVQNQFDSINFGANVDQEGYGTSLDDWRSQVQDEPDRNPMSGFMESLRGAYGKTPALDEYRSYLKSSPQAADYAPGKWDRLAAGLGGIAAGLRNPAEGIKVAQGMNRSKYDTALKDYYAQAAPLKEAAGIERESQQDRVKTLLETQERQQKYMDYVRNLNKDERDYLVASGKLKVDMDTLGFNREKWGTESYQAGQKIGIDRQLADSLTKYRTDQTNVDRQNAGTAAAGQRSLTAQRENDIFWDNMTGGGSRNTQRSPSAGDARTAQQDVMADLSVKYPGVIAYNEDEKAYNFTTPPPVGSPEYNTYRQVQEEVAGRANVRARSGEVTFGDYSAAGAGGPTNFGGSYNPEPPPSLPNFGASPGQRRAGRRYGPQ